MSDHEPTPRSGVTPPPTPQSAPLSRRNALALLGIGSLALLGTQPASAGPTKPWTVDVDANGNHLFNLGSLQMLANPRGITDFEGANLTIDQHGVLNATSSAAATGLPFVEDGNSPISVTDATDTTYDLVGEYERVWISIDAADAPLPAGEAGDLRISAINEVSTTIVLGPINQTAGHYVTGTVCVAGRWPSHPSFGENGVALLTNVDLHSTGIPFEPTSVMNVPSPLRSVTLSAIAVDPTTGIAQPTAMDLTARVYGYNPA